MNPLANQFGRHAIEVMQELDLPHSIVEEENEYLLVKNLAPQAIGFFISSIYNKAMEQGVLYDELVAAYNHVITNSNYNPSTLTYTFQLTDY